MKHSGIFFGNNTSIRNFIRIHIPFRFESRKIGHFLSEIAKCWRKIMFDWYWCFFFLFSGAYAFSSEECEGSAVNGLEFDLFQFGLFHVHYAYLGIRIIECNISKWPLKCSLSTYISGCQSLWNDIVSFDIDPWQWVHLITFWNIFIPPNSYYINISNKKKMLRIVHVDVAFCQLQ